MWLLSAAVYLDLTEVSISKIFSCLAPWLRQTQVDLYTNCGGTGSKLQGAKHCGRQMLERNAAKVKLALAAYADIWDSRSRLSMAMHVSDGLILENNTLVGYVDASKGSAATSTIGLL